MPHGLVPNVRACRIAYEKRKNDLMKKACEFSVLCGVDTCVVSACLTTPEIWPLDGGEASCIMEHYRSRDSRHAFTNWKKKMTSPSDLVNTHNDERGKEDRDGGCSLKSVQRRPFESGQHAEMGRWCPTLQRSLQWRLLGHPHSGG
ncbi:hypothetical protein BT93_L2084 [Corymbia citriodora subsp. variegata]|uniref:MADS-box domain-containing protein n=1 Tax=Corymbia citriodora subsp. variegata TaxID=360336 RepID=A0A8T0CL40_CORYI|nr:hypothetical protein BT93_L2084 [Corymbia citriodora subsp. variegata]